MALSLDLIDDARAFLEGRIRRTPVEASPGLSEALGVPVWLKLECLQVTGSFKVRGAFFALSRLAAPVVATCSAGNHGKGVAHAARALGKEAHIYVPRTVDAAKYRAMKALGATVIRSEYDGYDDTEAWAREEAARAGLPFLSAFDDPAVMAGNGGTLAAEVLADVPDARAFVVPVGGGGLAAGFARYVSAHRPGARLIACQHEGCPALSLSLARGAAVTRMPPLDTLAGGLEGGLGVHTFAELRDHVAHVALVSEQALCDAVRWMLDRHQYLIEPSAAVTVAACRTGALPPLEGPVVVVLSGRNVSLETVRQVLG